MPKTSLRLSSTSDTKEARLVALENFTPGAYVRHKITGKQGVFQELNLGYVLPEVWVQFESETEILVPTSCNPLDLELLESTEQQMEEISSKDQLTSSETVVTVEATATIALVMEELTEEEASERQRLELKVERAFYEAGTALRELRDQGLYRSTHPDDFEGYCRDRFGKTKQSVNYLIAAAGVYKNLATTIGCRVLPTSERQVRDVASFEKEVQIQIWSEAVAIADGKVPSSRIVKSVVERIKEKPLHLASDYCQSGEVFFLQRLTEGQRKYNGYWAIAIEVENRFTVKAAVYKEVVEVKQENMKRIDSEQTQAEIQEIYERIRRLLECHLDPIDEV